MKKYILVFSLFLSFSGYSQNTINNYKYALVPVRFSFLSEDDQYSLNSVTKAVLQNKGFIVFSDNAELPAELVHNKCLALNADLLEKSSMFSTGLTLVLKDCHGNVVFKSKQGSSREKEYRAAYTMALKDAVTSLDQVPYAYNGSTNEAPAVPPVTTAPKVTTGQIAVVTPVVATGAAANPNTATLYAQAIPNGYQLIDTTPKKVLTLLKTSTENYFIASSDTANGIVLKINDDWFFEYYKDGKLITEKLLVKF
ncbi:hypothetical protein ACFGVR_21195 [Mucilaginibacter sp. AW1-3]